ncbi:MAG TPA: hypothetical protein DCZ97_17385 [Syntrophus sp. (in: bacteria)]|nr:MAG: hypothetical protein A2X92_07880 [Syntrophus sp. GWC2_56_31]HBB18678.1 hypothetical protein [Syntrophus sp. (in: bacteria)]
MNREELLGRITIDPGVMVGKPTIRGMRITIEQILKSLAGGITMDALLEDYPELEMADLQAALLYASEIVSDEKVFAIQAG